jgi:hypothetical protein
MTQLQLQLPLLLFFLMVVRFWNTYLPSDFAVVTADTFNHGTARLTFLPTTAARWTERKQSQHLLLSMLLRGGSDENDDAEENAADDDDEDNDDVAAKEEDEDDDESAPAVVEDVKFDAALAAAALKSATKTKIKAAQQKSAMLKKTVNAKLASSASASSKKSSPKKGNPLSKMIRIPYIVRAALNPFTFFAMTKSYWASLFNLNYLQQQMESASPGQELRSAFEERAKRTVVVPSKGGSPKRKRTMKRGQAKTLADLPQLSS